MHDVATTMWDLTRTHYTYAMKVTSDAPTPAAKQSKAADITMHCYARLRARSIARNATASAALGTVTLQVCKGTKAM